MQKAEKKRLNWGFGISMLLLVLSAAASIYSIAQLNINTEVVRHRYRSIIRLQSILSDVKDGIITQNGFTLTGNSVYTRNYTATIKHLDSTIALLQNDAEFSSNKIFNKIVSLKTAKVADINSILKAKERGENVTIPMLLDTRKVGDSLTRSINMLTAQQQVLLKQEQRAMVIYRTYTPVFILVAALLAITITLLLVNTLVKQIKERGRLQQELNRKNEQMTGRINAIKNVADAIAAGNYDIRVEDADTEDELGSIAVNLENMGAALKTAFTESEERRWLQGSLATLNQSMLGDKMLQRVTYDVLNAIINITGCKVGAFYLIKDDGLQLAASYALNTDQVAATLAPGQGLAGQAARGEDVLLLDNNNAELSINTITGNITPQYLAAVPVCYEGRCVAVLELADNKPFSAAELQFLNQAPAAIGLAILAADNRAKLQGLLLQTREQKDELVDKQAQLESINAELEAQTQKLQASEEELRVQQEELLQSNQELEERSSLLEEKNRIIEDRNAEIQAKANELEQSTRYKSEFLANMSHELRTPLNSILLLSRLMSEDTKLDTEFVDYAQVIQTSGQGLLALIDEILDLSKIEAGKMTVSLAEVSFNEVMRDMTALFNPVAKDKGLQLVTNISPELPAVFTTDKMRLEQILKNLLSNALKFTTKGAITVSFNKGEGDNQVLMSVSDTGIGIPTEKQGLVFEAFQQADGSTVRKFGGTGLGLSISRELARLLGGNIILTSKEGEGSTFTVNLPLDGTVARAPEKLKVSAPAQAVNLPPAVPQPGSYTVDNIPQPLADDRDSVQPGEPVILIVEDDTAFARVLQKYTREKGYKCIVAVRGDDGLKLAQYYLPLAILLDIQLPVMDGWQVIEQLKSNSATRHIPVHIMSSMEVRKESIISGAVDFISKPFAMDEMPKIFNKLEKALNNDMKKVLIIEDNQQHAEALSYFLNSHHIETKAADSVEDGLTQLKDDEVNCVILDMGVPGSAAYEALEAIKKTEGMENLPVIIFTGKSLSTNEQERIKQYADSVVVKTAHSYERIIDEVGIFLHLIAGSGQNERRQKPEAIEAMQNILEGKKVLIAEDDVRNIFSLTKALESQRMQVVIAENGREAIARLNENPDVDIVLMDIMMPEMDGYDAIKNIRANPKFANLPVLAVTAKTSIGDREKCIQAGASDYISKPIDIYQLLSLLKVWLYNIHKK